LPLRGARAALGCETTPDSIINEINSLLRRNKFWAPMLHRERCDHIASAPPPEADEYCKTIY
jgi:hypothetical protein